MKEQKNKISLKEIHRLNELGIRNYEHDIQQKLSYHNQAIRLARAKLNHGLSSEVYYELAHAYAQKSLMNKKNLKMPYYLLKTMYFNRKSLVINPDNDLALYLAGAIASFFKNESKAEMYYKRALEVEPQNLSAAKSLVQIYKKRLDYDSAIEVLKSSIHNNTDNKVENRRRIELMIMHMRMDSNVIYEVEQTT